MAQKIIAVVGATGKQGGGVVRAILNDASNEFAVRAITRKRDSVSAQELAKLGVEVVEGDLDNQASIERAFAGAYGAFCLTNFFDHWSPEKETEQAKTQARAAKAAGLKHVVWSTLEDTRQSMPLSDGRMPTLMGNYKVPHFDAKGSADATFVELGIPTTFLRTSFYWENMIDMGLGPQRGPDGKLAITMPMGDKALPGMAVNDIGKCVNTLFKLGQAYIGKTIGIVGEKLTGNQMAAALTQALGESVLYNDVPADVYRGFGFPGAEEVGNMFQFKRDFEHVWSGNRNLELSKSLNPSMLTFDAWLDRNKSRIPV
ncbi:MAG: NmrA/HSCARG family protein [Rhizobium sp.]